MNQTQLEMVRTKRGIFAALDQSGGSTRGALAEYGVPESSYSSDDEMFSLMHEMRTRIITSPAFSADHVLGAILFEDTIDREIEGVPTVTYVWEHCGIVPFLKVDKGLESEADGVQLMKPMPGLDDVLVHGFELGVFGTKMRSFIKMADPKGVRAIVDQQFAIGRQIAAAGLMPILEAEVDIHSPEKAAAEVLLRDAIVEGLADISPEQPIMFKLTLPEVDHFYDDLVADPRVLRMLALSGGYPRVEANARLARNHGVIASFSRALISGLSAQMSDEAFHAELDSAITSIYGACGF